MNIIEKNAKFIGIGNDGIDILDNVYSSVEQYISFDKILINQDISKDYVRTMLDGVDILFLAYKSEDKRSSEIVKAISFMARERRVLCIGINSSANEKKEDLGVNRELKVHNNLQELSLLINAIAESISELCLINIDVTDLKEVIGSEKGLKYSYKEYDKSVSYNDIMCGLSDSMIILGEELIKKKGLILIDIDEDYCIEEDRFVVINEILSKLNDGEYETIFSCNVKPQKQGKIRICTIYN